MAFRLMYKISSNVQKSGLFKNASYVNLTGHCLSKSSTPAVSEKLVSKDRHGRGYNRGRRSLSYPSVSPIRSPLRQQGQNMFKFQQKKALTTTLEQEEDEYVKRKDLEYESYENETEGVKKFDSQLNHLRSSRKPISSVNLQKQATYPERENVNQVEKREHKKPPKFQFKKKAEFQNTSPYSNAFTPYRLRDSKPGKRQNFVDVFTYFSRKYELADKVVVPHLQPNNLKPFGTSTNLPFPNALRKRTLSYPLNPQAGQEQTPQPTNTPKTTTSKASQEREYSTASVADNLKQQEVSAEYTPNIPNRDVNHKTASNSIANARIKPKNKHKSYMEEERKRETNIKVVKQSSVPTIRDLQMQALYKCSLYKQNKTNRGRKAKLIGKPKTSLKRNIQPQPKQKFAFHKLNTVYLNDKTNKNMQKMLGNDKVNKRKSTPTLSSTKLSFKKRNLNYASNVNLLQFRGSNKKEVRRVSSSTRSYHKTLNKTYSQPSLARYKSNEASSHDVEQTETLLLPDTTKSTLNPPEPKGPVERKKFSFSKKLDLPEEVHTTQVIIKVSPKTNLLQSNLFPESVTMVEEVRLGKNEKLIAPWPSYSERYRELKSNRNVKAIPTTGTETKVTEIQEAKPVALNASTRQLHFLCKPPMPQAYLAGIRRFHSMPCILSYLKKLAPLYELSKSYYSTKKGTFCPDKRVPAAPDPSLAKDFDCPCIEPHQPSYAPPLKRLIKRNKPTEPPKICPAGPTCPPRADANLKLKIKPLPKIVPPTDCPCVELIQKEGKPLPRLKAKKVVEPPKICPAKFRCPPRADEGMKWKKKRLPVLKAGDCPCITPPKPIDVAPLKPLNLKFQPSPRVCPKPLECPPRADNQKGAKVLTKKKLPVFKPSNCPCIEPKPPVDVPLHRLKKFKAKDPPRICIEEVCDPNSRADAICGYKVEDKKLPTMILKAENNHVRAPLLKSKRRKFSTYGAFFSKFFKCRWFCSRFSTHKRFYSKKKDCECIEPYYPEQDATPELKRLPKFVKEDTDWAKLKKCKEDECKKMPRADDNLKAKKRQLPKLEPGKCPCIDLYEDMIDCTELTRLPKFKKEDKNWNKQCPKKICKRADDNLKEKKRSLPSLKPTHDCPCIDPLENMKDCDELQRLPKFKKTDVNWKELKKCADKPCAKQIRADDGLCEETKRLPKLEPGNCPCIDLNETIIDCTDLPRLPKFKKEDKDWNQICPKPPCIRADDNLKEKKRRLPVLTAARDCPCIEPRTATKDCDKLRRLPKFKKPDVNWKERCKGDPCKEAKRADDNINEKSKRLPKLEAGSCPCIDLYEDMIDCTELIRLPKYKKEDRNWNTECPKKICIRADDNLKEKKRSLPVLKPARDCPCIDPLENIKDCEELQRLPKFKKTDVNWRELKKCADHPCARPERADDGLCEETKKLPKLEPGNCPCIDLNETIIDCTDLPRLPKFKKEDKDWNQICPKPPCIRADDNLKEKQKRLPVLKAAHNCPCIEPQTATKDCDELPRLPKFKKSDVDWKKQIQCKGDPCKETKRADDNLRQETKRLPKLEAGSCPCIDLYEDMIDCTELIRLPKYKKEDRDWNKECPKKICIRADDNLKERKRSLPALKPARNCPCIDPLENMKDCEELQRLPKYKKTDVNWKELKKCADHPCARPQRADDGLCEETKRLPKLEPGNCPCIDLNETIIDCTELPRLPKFKKEDKDWNQLCPNPPCVRADDNLPEKKRQLPKLKAGFIAKPKTARRPFPITRKREFHTFGGYKMTTNMYSSNSGKRECKKLKPSATKTRCPQLKLPGCPPRARLRCDDGGYPFKPCTKQKTPYPSFSECGDLPDPPTCDCKVPDLRVLQPKYPLLGTLEIQKAPPPEQGPIDTSLEKECVMKKLSMKNEGKTETCDDFGETALEFPAKELLKEAEQEAAKSKGKAKEKNVCCENKGKPGEKGVCPKVDLHKCGSGEKLTAKTKPKKRPSMICGAADDKKDKKDKCATKKKKSKDPCGSKKTKEKKKAASGSKKTKKARSPCPKLKNPCDSKDSKKKKATVCAAKKTKPVCKAKPKKSVCAAKKPKAQPKDECQEEKPKGLWARICAFFCPRPNCPKPGEWKQKKLKADAEEAAKKAGYKLCPIDPCKATKIKMAKAPTKKGVSKVKKHNVKTKGASKKSGSKKGAKKNVKVLKTRPCTKDSKSKKTCGASAGKSQSPCAKAKPPCSKPKASSKKTCGQKKSKSSCSKRAKSNKSSGSCGKRKSKSSCSKNVKSSKSAGSCGKKKSKSPCSKGAKSSKSTGSCGKQKSKSPCSKSVKSSKSAGSCGKKKSKSPCSKKAKPSKSSQSCGKKKSKSPCSKKAKSSKSSESCGKKKSKSPCSKKVKPSKSSKSCGKKKSKSPCSKAPKKSKSGSSCKSKSPKRSKSNSSCKSAKSTKSQSSCGSAQKPKKSKCGTQKRSKSSCSTKSTKSKSCGGDKKRSSSKSSTQSMSLCEKAKKNRPKSKDSCGSKKSSNKCGKSGKGDKCSKPENLCKKASKPKSPKPKKKANKCGAKADKCGAKKEKKKCPKLQQKSQGKCKQFKVDCPPRARDSCTSEYVFKPCKPQEAPYPSFSEIRPPFPPLPINECTIAHKKSRYLKSQINMTPGKNKDEKGGSRKYSTMANSVTQSNLMRVFLSTQFKQNYSTHTRQYHYERFLNDIEEKMNNPRKSSYSLSKKLSECINEGVRQMQSPDDLPKRHFQTIIAKLRELAEAEDSDHSEVENAHRAISSLKNYACESIDNACTLSPRAEKSYLNNIKFEPRCLGISDSVNQKDEKEMMEAFQNFCYKIVPEAPDLPFEETERIITEEIKEELNELLEKCKKEEI